MGSGLTSLVTESSLQPHFSASSTMRSAILLPRKGWVYYSLFLCSVMMFLSTHLIRPALSFCNHLAFLRPSPFNRSVAARSLAADYNPTLEWKGASHSTSGYVHHYLVSPEEAPIAVTKAVDFVLQERRRNSQECTNMTAAELIAFGAVWFLPATAPRNPSQGVKPERLSETHVNTLILQQGDYLRIHHHPRRFPAIHDYDWSKTIYESSDNPGVIVAQYIQNGWLVIDKPAMVPVHMTVDNSVENVAACLKQARRDAGETDPYVTTPQRLDQNTSGLLVISTSKAFAAYYAKLLSSKTAKQLQQQNDSQQDPYPRGGIHKLYRCLVCLIPPSERSVHDERGWSVNQAVAELKAYANEQKVMRHYLEPSIRAPKRFDTAQHDESWLECLLRIRKVGEVCALVGNQVGQDLAKSLWKDVSDESPRIPPNCQAVVEVEVELLTGRTHQIRGQFAACGYPLVGDAQYGGTVPRNPDPSSEFYYGSERLALQCCELEFLDPDIVEKKDGSETMACSQRWNRFRLQQAWWTPLIQKYRGDTIQVSADDVTTLASDIGLTESQPSVSKEAKPDMLPPRVSLSPGKNKYVLIRAKHPNDDEVLWFVKSATPAECGGPYHGNVAQDLREWIEAAGYKVTVTGGGRIDYIPEENVAVVYGFSYGFGKGDHAHAAALINEWSKGSIQATYDNRDGLY